MKTIKLSFLFVVLSLIVGCTSNNFTEPTEEVTRELSFVGEKEDDTPQTRVSGNQWQSGDKIGVFSWKNGSDLSQATVEQNIYNRVFSTTGNGRFTAVNTPSVTYPTKESPQDFIAYYPYTDNPLLLDFIYPINIEKQNNISAIDFLFSNNLKSIDGPAKSMTLVFKHQLAKLELKLQSNSVDLTGAKVVLKNLPTKADFVLINGNILLDASSSKDIEAHVSMQGTSVLAEAFVIPNPNQKDFFINIILKDGTTYKWRTPANWKWEKGYKNSKILELNAEEDGSGETPKPLPKVAYFEYPSLEGITSRQQVVMHMDPENTKQRNFTMLYDKDMLFAYWIAFPHHNYYMGSIKRTNAWGYDPDINQNDQPSLKSSYSGNYSRGHQVASSDRTRNKSMNQQTFYYSNMTPQVQTFNGGIWLELERDLQDLVKRSNDTIYVVTGAGIYDKSKMRSTTTKSGQKAPIPDYYYKLMARKMNGNYQTIAYFMNHEGSVGTFRNYAKTVKEVEEITGFTFYPSLPDPKAKETLGTGIWN